MALGCVCALFCPIIVITLLCCLLFFSLQSLPWCRAVLVFWSSCRNLEAGLSKSQTVSGDIITPACSIKHFGFNPHLQPTKPQLDFHAHCQCSSFQNTCHLSTWHMSVSMVSDCIQNSFKSKKSIIFHSRSNNGKRVHSVALSQIMVKIKSNILWYLHFLLFSILVCKRKASVTVKVLFFHFFP